MGQVWLIHSALERFEASMNRCLADPAFLERFYERFMGSSPEVAAKFTHTNLPRQIKMLGDSLRLVLKAAGGLEEGREHLTRIAESHSARGLGIDAELYILWLQSLVSTAEETDPEWNPALDQTWRAALRPCIDAMIAAS
ncbi:MAG: globin [Sandaracinaceae bacterium]